MKFSLDEVNGDIYTSVFLNDYYPWYKRTWIALKYIFGYKSKYGHWDCFEMKPEDYVRFRKLLAKSEQALLARSNSFTTFITKESNGNQEETTISRS